MKPQGGGTIVNNLRPENQEDSSGMGFFLGHLIWRLQNIFSLIFYHGFWYSEPNVLPDKGKPIVRWGRKATDPYGTAGLPTGDQRGRQSGGTFSPRTY